MHFFAWLSCHYFELHYFDVGGGGGCVCVGWWWCFFCFVVGTLMWVVNGCNFFALMLGHCLGWGVGGGGWKRLVMLPVTKLWLCNYGGKGACSAHIVCVVCCAILCFELCRCRARKPLPLLLRRPWVASGVASLLSSRPSVV